MWSEVPTSVHCVLLKFSNIGLSFLRAEVLMLKRRCLSLEMEKLQWVWPHKCLAQYRHRLHEYLACDNFSLQSLILLAGDVFLQDCYQIVCPSWMSQENQEFRRSGSYFCVFYRLSVVLGSHLALTVICKMRDCTSLGRTWSCMCFNSTGFFTGKLKGIGIVMEGLFPYWVK